MEKDAFRYDAVSSAEAASVTEVVAEKSEYSREQKRETGRKVLELYSQSERPADEPAEVRFHVDEAEFPIFARQAVSVPIGNGKSRKEELPIDETLGRMVGATAETIEAILGERDTKTPRAEHVIYLDKSARPVSWLVDEFWQDFTAEPRPEKTFLAIDRRNWLKPPYTDEKADSREYVTEASGEKKLARAEDFHVERVPTELLAGIHGLYVEGGIPADATPEEVMEMPTVLDGKNVMIIDEVSRSGATLGIAQKLIGAAIPKVQSVTGHVFWRAGSFQLDNGESQMASAPVWYPEDADDASGRGVMDINELYYKNLYLQEPSQQNLALMKGAFVLGEPLLKPEEERGQKSLRLRGEVRRMREEYEAGHILPTIANNPDSEVTERMLEKLEECGVELVQSDPKKKNPRAYQVLLEQRAKKSPAAIRQG